jgi:hypothetical protein
MRLHQFMSVTTAIAAVLLSTAAVAQAPAVGNDNIGGVVMSPNGPEAGVWVVAETTDLPTRLIKSVVTDDQGRYLTPNCRKQTTKSSRAATA